MTQRVMHIAEVGWRVKDLPRMMAFYQEVLGLEIVHTYPKYVCYEGERVEFTVGPGRAPTVPGAV